MPYTGSASQTGSQTIFNINTGTVATPVYTPIGEIVDFSQSGKSNKTAEVTNLQSAGEEFIATLLSPGKFDLTYNRVSADLGQAAVKTSFDNKTTVMYSIVLPKSGTQTTTGDSYKFTAIVEGLDDVSSVSPTKQLTAKASLKVSGTVALTLGT